MFNTSRRRITPYALPIGTYIALEAAVVMNYCELYQQLKKNSLSVMQTKKILDLDWKWDLEQSAKIGINLHFCDQVIYFVISLIYEYSYF